MADIVNCRAGVLREDTLCAPAVGTIELLVGQNPLAVLPLTANRLTSTTIEAILKSLRRNERQHRREIAMIRQLCTAVVMILGLGLTAHSQCFLLDEGSDGFVIKGGYLRATKTTGTEFNLSYAFDRKVELGVGGGHMSTTGFWDYKTNVTTSGQFLNVYPTRSREENEAVIIGLHQSLSTSSGSGGGTMITVGATLNAAGLSRNGGGLILTIGGFGATQIDAAYGQDYSQGYGLVRISYVRKRADNNHVGFFLQYTTARGPDVYGGGLIFTLARN
jgi:hypothetical protein